jgi:hypothetical protein
MDLLWTADWNSIKPPVLPSLVVQSILHHFTLLLHTIGFQLQSLLDFQLRLGLVYSINLQLRLEW